MKKNYFKLDIIGSNGYSFMVCTTETNEDAVLDLAVENNLFANADDRDRCIIDILVDNNDIQRFIEWGFLYELD